MSSREPHFQQHPYLRARATRAAGSEAVRSLGADLKVDAVRIDS